uniref:Uncharacterized protein n=1 Tax=Tanacetum cinerariifolium TaxID=118510 RepID=A0A6L2KS05_TANCI|nr:hypothetical protein [Tanacetum cinerariifolium]
MQLRAKAVWSKIKNSRDGQGYLWLEVTISSSSTKPIVPGHYLSKKLRTAPVGVDDPQYSASFWRSCCCNHLIRLKLYDAAITISYG